ncbi:MAG: hypothetical protein R3B46_06535 [Phycisphaerales bacterium]
MSVSARHPQAREHDIEVITSTNPSPVMSAALEWLMGLLTPERQHQIQVPHIHDAVAGRVPGARRRLAIIGHEVAVLVREHQATSQASSVPEASQSSIAGSTN